MPFKTRIDMLDYIFVALPRDNKPMNAMQEAFAEAVWRSDMK